jgi:PadR family transcriptional regulator PadR
MLTGGDRYGYELTDAISKEMEIASGTLYLVLRRLKEENLVTTYLRESENGPARKYYHLTDAGRDYQNGLKKDWLAFVRAVAGIVGE